MCLLVETLTCNHRYGWIITCDFFEMYIKPVSFKYKYHVIYEIHYVVTRVGIAEILKINRIILGFLVGMHYFNICTYTNLSSFWVSLQSKTKKRVSCSTICNWKWKFSLPFYCWDIIVICYYYTCSYKDIKFDLLPIKKA